MKKVVFIFALALLMGASCKKKDKKPTPAPVPKHQSSVPPCSNQPSPIPNFDGKWYLDTDSLISFSINHVGSVCSHTPALNVYDIRRLYSVMKPYLNDGSEYVMKDSTVKVNEEMRKIVGDQYVLKTDHFGGKSGIVLSSEHLYIELFFIKAK